MMKSTIPTITTDQMREVDRLMIEEYGISLEQMMENAGRNLADLALELIYMWKPSLSNYTIVVVCGTGNNGGGGMVAARYLSNRGMDVHVILANIEDKLKPIPYKRWNTLKKLPVKCYVGSDKLPADLYQKTDLIIDAIIGYSLSGEPRGIPGKEIQTIIKSKNQNVLSLDVPSGLDATTGNSFDICIKARATMTLALPKTGLVRPNAKKYVGDLYLADIGVPPSLYRKIGLSAQPLFIEETIIKLS